jgi:hypothetical protein
MRDAIKPLKIALPVTINEKGDISMVDEMDDTIIEYTKSLEIIIPLTK